MIQRKTQGLAFSNGQNLHILLYVINTAPSMTMVDSNHEIKPNGNDLVMLCSFSLTVEELVKGGVPS